MIDVVILCGGQGTRLRSLHPDIPKPLAPVGGRPFLQGLIDYVQSEGFPRIVLSAGYRADQIQAFCDQQGYGDAVVVSVEPEPMGTGGGLRFALPQLRTEDVAVLNGDSFCPFSLRQMAQQHVERGALATVAVSELEDVAEYGSVELGPDGELTRFREKRGVHEPGLINAGVYLLRKSVIQEIPADRPASLEKDVFPALAGRGLDGYLTHAPVYDIGTPDRLFRAQQAFAAGTLGASHSRQS